MADHGNMKLGKQPARFDARTFRLANYIPPTWVPEREIDYTNGVTDWGVMKNDLLGDCTIAACAHAIQSWTMGDVTPYTGMITPADAAVVGLYESWTGYDPTAPWTDRGAVPLDILNRWRKEGFDGHKIVAFAQPQPQNVLHIKRSISRFGGVYVGLQLPVSAQNQDVWDVVPQDGGVWGGHAVWCPKYGPEGITCITWGALKLMTWAFWDKYCDESWAILSEEWEGALSRGPEGLDVAALKVDLANLNG